MNLSGNTVLVTGGATGIGLAVARHFYENGSTVILCGRRKDALIQAQKQYPRMIVHQCDVSKAPERVALRDFIRNDFPAMNILINNAGIQRRIHIAEADSWSDTQSEIATNLEAPIHLAQLFLPHLMHRENPAIINVTSGLSFSPLATVPVYCATKAALHSFTISLRHQLAKTAVKVVELVPPAVNTDLGGPGLHTFGVDVNEFADSVMKRIAAGELEVGFGLSEGTRLASRPELEVIFKRMNEKS